ncbi:EIF4ENIF1 [Acanthosepion pharaonis]|uniref:EIF4ENIF1 n=1 Tax=Acanthosepion pharaonis TaxID=158019 RepID=A0A812D4X9_ACAPH|nr:EIF4ENIF1 [Sepia pharaonis]
MEGCWRKWFGLKLPAVGMMEHRNAESIQDENVQAASPVHHQYSRERLLELKKVPAARSKPCGLSKEFYTPDGIWDPEKWFKAFSASREGSPLTVGDGRERRRPTDLDRESLFRRRLSDPKERLREERDCIVLSPQRRSFGTGCHVTLSGIGRQISCPPDFKDSGGQRERTRRIGSGRIQLEKDHNSRYDNREERFERNDSRAEGFRSSVHDRRDLSHRRMNPSGRRRSFRRQEEDATPEWFTDGPNSQADTIELRGFDGVGDQQEEDIEEELQIGGVNRKEFLEHIDEENISNISVSERNGSLETNESSSPEDSPPSDNVHGTPPQTSSLFDFDQFIQIHIPMLGLMPDGGGEESEANQGSRFSRWFSRASNQGSRTNSRRSSLTDENGFLQDLIETQSPTTISSSSTSPTVLGTLSLPPPSQDPHLQQHSSLLRQSHTSAALSQQSHPPQPLQQAPPQLHQQLHQQHEDKNPSLFSVSTHPLDRSSPPSPQHKKDCQPPALPSPTTVASTHSTNILQCKMSLLDSYNQHQPKNSVLNSLFSLNSAMMEKPDAGRSCSPSGPGVSAQDASAQLKALLFGKERNESVSASPTPNMPPYNMPGQVKTLAEIEADMHQPPSNNGIVSVSPVMEVPDCSGDMSAFNKLLSMMKAAAVDSSKTQMQDRSPATSVPPPQTIPYNLISGQNEFLHALSRNKERQLQIQQQTLQQIRMQQMQQQMQQQASQSQQHSAGPPPPPPTTGGSGTTVGNATISCTQYPSGQQASSDAILNFIKQNPAIITKPASPSPQLAAVLQQTASRTQSPGAPPLHSGPPTQFLQQNLLAAQQSPMHSTSQQRIPSPIMFSQQPPVHLSAPAPVHPSPLVQSSLAQPVNTNLTNVGSVRPQGLLHRVTSPQEMASVQSQVLTQIAIKKKKELDDQKERILRKQQADRSKSPVHFLNQRGIPTPVNVNSNKTSVSVSFTPTSVIRKMHSEKAVEKERQAKQDGCNTNSYSAQKSLVKSQMFGDNVLKDVYLNSCAELTSNGSQMHGSCDSGDKELSDSYGPGSMNGPSLKNQDGGAAVSIVNLSHGQQQSHTNLPMDSSIVAGSMNINVTSSSSVTSSPTSSAKSSKSTSHDTSLSGNAGEILAAQLLNHEQNSSPSQASSSSPCDQSKSVRALMGQGMMQNLSVHMQQNVPSTAATSAAQQLTATLAGRPIVKGNMKSANPLCPVAGLQSLPSAAAAGIARSLSLNSTSSPFGIPVNSRVPPPLQSNAIPPNIGVHPANIQMQLMFQGMNPLAAMHAHRSAGLESRFPSGMRGVYPGMVAPMLSSRASLAAAAASSIGVPSNPAAGGVVNVGVGRAVSPQIPSLHKQVTVPGNNGQKTSLQSLGLSNTGGADVLKWFDSEVLRNQLPNMPLPPQGQKVVTVDELERCQQAVSN